ncbi:MAG: hypothetical protein DWQ03_01450 [Calditrichaeota bacterium]|nr:MAG: hypothetical protein DWQ03_01450 [Calditrichota bacterium]NOG47042.1 hypothetical protein [Calditrichota bacterium]
MNRNKIFTILIVIVLSGALFAHEPLFGLGPHTIYEAGYAIETEFEKSDDELVNQLELLYGFTPDWAVTIALPYQFTNDNKNGSLGRLTLRSKFRFYRDDMKGASKQAAIHAGIQLPTGKNSIDATDFFAGLSFGYESRRHYFFTSARFRYNRPIDNLERGHVFKYDVAYGIRPWLLEYLQPDPVFLIELTGEIIDQNSLNGVNNPDSGGNLISIAPGLLFSYRNIMLKAGIKIPILNGLNGSQKLPGNEYILGLEIHFPPLY